MGWLVLSARYGNELELCTMPGLGIGPHCWGGGDTLLALPTVDVLLLIIDAVLTTDGRHTIVVGGITVVTVFVTDGVRAEDVVPLLLVLTVLVIRLSELTISGVSVTSSSNFTWLPLQKPDEIEYHE